MEKRKNRRIVSVIAGLLVCIVGGAGFSRQQDAPQMMRAVPGIEECGLTAVDHDRTQRSTLIGFDDLMSGSPIGNHYSGVTFSPGWMVWDSTGNPDYPPHSIPNIAYSHETDSFIEWDDTVVNLSLYVSTVVSTSETWSFSVYNADGILLQQRAVSEQVVNTRVSFSASGIRRLEITGTGVGWSDHYVIDDLYYEDNEHLPCPEDAVLSRSMDVDNPSITGKSSDEDSGFFAADRYTLSPGQTISAVRWWGFLDPDIQGECLIRFHPDDGGKPAETAGVHPVTATLTYTGYTVLEFDLWQFDAELPVNETLTDGWISITGVPDGTVFYWATTTTGRYEAMGRVDDGDWFSETVNFAFCLSGTDAPTPTPSPTATPSPGCSAMGCTIEMPYDEYNAGTTCYCRVHVCNTDTLPFTDVPVFVILDVYGTLFFAPSFGAFDYYADPLPPGMSTIDVLPEFPWPAGAGEAHGINFYAAMTNPEMTELLGEMDMITFGWNS